MQVEVAPQFNAQDFSGRPDVPLSLARRQARSHGSLDEKDDALILGISRGSERSFRRFYRRFAPGVYSMVWNILKDHREAEDALQEAFLQIWKRIATFDAGRSKLFTWVTMIARSKAIDRLRAQDSYRRATIAAAEEISAAPAKQESAASDLLELVENRARVRAAVNRLTEDQRKAIDLAFFVGMSQSEISRALGQPLGTIKARIRRGLASLRDALEKEESIHVRAGMTETAQDDTPDRPRSSENASDRPRDPEHLMKRENLADQQTNKQKGIKYGNGTVNRAFGKKSDQQTRCVEAVGHRCYRLKHSTRSRAES